MKSADFSITFDSSPAPAQNIFLFEGAPSLEYFCESEPQKKRLFVTDSNVAELPAVKDFFSARFPAGAHEGVFVLPAGEEHKTMDNVLLIIKTALKLGMNRKSVFTAIGGGVVTDITGFAASIFMRGASWDAVPTTLLGMVDAAIGGKTGCDFDGYKNMTGSFFPAKNIFIAPEFIKSLPEREYLSGLGEVIKTALLFSPRLFDFFKREKSRILSRETDALMFMVRECAQAKARVVQEDFLEQGNRALLNFGHTFGHALETCAGLGAAAHGDAVAWGISRALALSAAKKLCADSYRDEVFCVLESYGWQTSARHTALGATTADTFIAAMKKDKKITGGNIRLILQKGLADNVITEVPGGELYDIL